MAFAVSEFKTNLKGGGARPSLFTVDIDAALTQLGIAPPASSKFLIKGASIPTSTIGTYDVFYHGKAIHVAGDRTFETWDTTIVNDEDYGIRIALEKWMDLVADHKLNTRRGDTFNSGEGETASYKKSIKVNQYSKTGEHIHHYHFLGAFPTTLSAIPLDWGTASEIEEYTVTWTYDRWMPGTSAKGPLTTVDHLLKSESHTA
jgi:hypothetical protein